jgi:hypothetical protein
VEHLSEVAADSLSMLSSSKIATVGFDTRESLVRDPEEDRHLKRLDAILASQSFPKILVRLEHDPLFDYNLSDSLNVIYRAFPLGRSHGILEVERLPYERRDAVRELTDDCLSTRMSNQATS